MTLAEHLRTAYVPLPAGLFPAKNVILKDICSALFFAIAVAEGCAEASGDSFWEEIQGKKFLKGFKKRGGEYHSRENFSFSRIKIYPDETKISYTEDKKTKPRIWHSRSICC